MSVTTLLFALLLVGVAETRPKITLVAHDHKDNRSRDLLFFVALQNAGNQEKRIPILRSKGADQQTSAICSEWKLDARACGELQHQVRYSWKQESLARADTRETLTRQHTEARDWLPSTPDTLGSENTKLLAALRAYGERHAAMVAGSVPGRWLVCQPTSGLGNQLNGIMSCVLAALASGRAMLLDWRATLKFNDIRRGPLARSLVR